MGGAIVMGAGAQLLETIARWMWRPITTRASCRSAISAGSAELRKTRQSLEQANEDRARLQRVERSERQHYQGRQPDDRVDHARG